MSANVFKLFPATLNNERQKVPLLKGWQEAATDNVEQIELWRNLYRDKLTFFGIPCGPVNNILVLDIDVKSGGFETVQKLGLVIPDTFSQRTLSGGIHYIFQYPKDGKHYGNRVGFKPGLDIRGEGGWIAFYGKECDWTKPILPPPDWLCEAALRASYDHTGSTVKVSPEIAEKLINDSLEAIRQAPEGESNNVLNTEAFKLGQLVASDSITREYAEAALFRAAKERGKPDYEARATIESGLNGGVKKPLGQPFGTTEPIISIGTLPMPGPPARWTPKRFTKYDLLNTSKLRKPQLFADWSTEDITITTADGGTGKTTLKLFEAVCLALGERFLGFDCKQSGKTLFITGEDTAEKLGAMLGAIMRQMGLFEDGDIHRAKVEIILDSIVIKKDSDLTIITKDRAGFLQPSQEALRKLMEAVDDLQPKMIVLDPISSFWGSESALNDMGKAVGKFAGIIAERGICVEMINHMGKVSSGQKDMTQFAGRGGTGLQSNTRVSRALRGITAQEYLEKTGETLFDGQSAMECAINKFTDGSALYNKPFIILREGYLFARKSLTPQKAMEAEKDLNHAERVFKFIKEQRMLDKYPSKIVVVAHFMTQNDSIAEAKVKRVLSLLEFSGHLGERIKLVGNPDMQSNERVYVITDMDGRET